MFRPLASYREYWNPEQGVAASGVFRSLSEDRPPTAAHGLTTTKIYITPSEVAGKIETVVTEQSERRKPTASSEVPNTLQVPSDKDSRTNPVADKTSENDRPDCHERGSELSKRNETKKLNSSGAKRDGSEPSGDSTQHASAPGSGSETVAGNRSRSFKLESSSAVPAGAEHQGMHPAARDTGQQQGFGSSGVSVLSRASSPGTNSSSGSSYNLSSTTEATGDSRGLRATPMGSTTGLLSDNTSSCSQSKLKVSTDVTCYVESLFNNAL